MVCTRRQCCTGATLTFQPRQKDCALKGYCTVILEGVIDMLSRLADVRIRLRPAGELSSAPIVRVHAPEGAPRGIVNVQLKMPSFTVPDAGVMLMHDTKVPPVGAVARTSNRAIPEPSLR